MGRQKRKTEKRPVFDSIRKPTAPPAPKLGEDRREQRAGPSLREAKRTQRLVQRGPDAANWKERGGPGCNESCVRSPGSAGDSPRRDNARQDAGRTNLSR